MENTLCRDKIPTNCYPIAEEKYFGKILNVLSIVIVNFKSCLLAKFEMRTMFQKNCIFCKSWDQ